MTVDRARVAAGRRATMPELEKGLPHVRASPLDHGTVNLIARRPASDQREVLEVGYLDPAVGLVGDYWLTKYDQGPDPATQLTLMNSRVAALVAGPPERWAIAGDQLYVDLNICYGNVPPGTRLSVGSAVIEVSAAPHTGCGKFLRRFGLDAQKFVNSPAGRELNLRGINARVLRAGAVRRGDQIAKLAG